MAESSSVSQDLVAQLRHASSAQLLELIHLHGREFSVREVRQVLLNPFVTGAVIEELLCLRQLLSAYEVRSAITRHRRTPQVAAQRFVAGLFWRDLLDISTDLRIAPAVRRLAEKYLVQRLGRLAVGEKMAIGRRATPAVLAHLKNDPSKLVFRSVLENPRLTEDLLLQVAGDSQTLPRILEQISTSKRWGSRYAIRVALSLNPQVPFRVVFEILPDLRWQDLKAVGELDLHSSIVRHRALELLEDRRIVPES